ncbi:MAG: TonB-dependent receptor [Chitinophagaceae bacterium]|nr:TonB-dependent receptor [Chitinophagaceae bacterium]
MRKTVILLLAFLTGFGALRTMAQETTAEIQGQVTDEKGTPLAGATINATHLPTGTTYYTTTRKDGRYNLPNVRVGGPYELKVTFVGFKEEFQRDITLSLGQVYRADFGLNPSSTNLNEVVVSARKNDKVFNKGRTGSAEFINRTQIDRLPTINRSINDFTRLTPTANSNATYGTSSFAGRANSYNNLTVNGASFNNTFGLAAGLGGQTNSQPISIDALDQIQVNIAPYDVTLGSFTGAGINSVTKSGTNEFKGSIYSFWKTPGLTGLKVGPTTIAKQQFDFNNRGVSLGGYIVKNKVFFFVSGEQERVSAPATSLVASRNGSSGVGISQAKASDLEALAAFLKSKYNYDAGAFENYNYDTYSDKLTARIDVNINKKNTFNINYYYLKSYRNVAPSNSGAPTGGRSASTTGMPFFSSSYIINNNFNIIIAELNTRINNRVSNKLQVGFNQLRDFRSSPGGIFPLVDIENGAGSTFTSFGYEPFTAFNKLNTDTWQLNDVLTVSKGKHSLTFGTQNTFNKFQNGFAPNYNGAYRFASLQDFYNSANNGTANATRYELRYSARKGGEFPYADVSTLQLGFFAQDKWNVTDNFNLTMGIRLDVPIFKQDFISNTNADALSFRFGQKIKTGQAPERSFLWSPRVGFNWDVNGDKMTQLRGGTGIFSGPPPFVWISNQASNNGVDFGSFVRASGTTAFNPDVNAYRPANGAANTAYNLAVSAENFKFPQIWRSNLAIDQKLPFDITATVEGIYSKDINAVYHQNINLPSAGTTLEGPDRRIRYAATQIYSGAGGVSATNPNISDVILMKNTSKGYTYNVTLQLQRNVKNLYTMLAYSYGSSKSVNDGGSIAQSIWRDRQVAGDPNLEWLSYSNFYQPHRVIAAAFYRFEYAKYLATSIGFTFEAANGGTSSYVYNGDLNNDGLTTNDLIYIPKTQNDIVLEGVNAADTRTASVLWGQLNAYINQDAYLSSRRGQYAERNGLLLPFYRRLDMNFTQDFSVNVGGKKNTIRLTFDIFNLGNLLNKNWGISRIPNRTALLNFKRVETTGANIGKPVYSFPFLDATNQLPLVNTFQNSTGTASRWQGQIGVRYIFN